MRALGVLGCGILVAMSLAHRGFAQQATVIRNVNLRPTASTAKPPQQLLKPPAVVTLISAKATAGYYHVRTVGDSTGWVWAHNISIHGAAQPADSGTVTPPSPPPAGSYAIDKPSCPPVGMHPDKTKKMVAYADTSDGGLRNEAKRHLPTGSVPLMLDLTAFGALQQDVNAKFGDARTTQKLFSQNRNDLKSLSIGSGKTVSEGQLVQFAAYVNAVHGEGKESVNCANKSADDSQTKDGNDIHINVGAKGSTEWKGLVVEMIPQLPRPAGWDTTTLIKIKTAQLQVLVVGGLTYDNEHFVNDDPAHPNGTQPKRITLWEIHPITAFYVCTKAQCDPAKHGDWTPLTDWAKANP